MMSTPGPATPTNNPITSEHVLVARQPIFERDRSVFGYELLFRGTDLTKSGVEGADERTGDAATATTINTSLNLVGLQALTGGKKALINVTRNVLLDEIYTVLPRELVIVELLETVEPDAEVIAACKKLKQAGYELALDDFVFHPSFKPLLELTDILKVDFLLSDMKQRRSMAAKFGGKMRLLAEKVETHEDVAQAMRFGYNYFQGYFYCKPQVISSRQIPTGKQNTLRFLQEANRDDICFDRLEEIVRQEMSLSVKMLRYLNSSAYGLRQKVTSIKHAMSLLGIKPLRKWASLVAMTSLGDKRGAALVIACLARARFCEIIGAKLTVQPDQAHLFLVGLLSGLDAMLDCEMDAVLAQLPLAEVVKQALLGTKSPMRLLLDLAITQERGDWQRLRSLSAEMGVTLDAVAQAASEASRWADMVSAV